VVYSSYRAMPWNCGFGYGHGCIASAHQHGGVNVEPRFSPDGKRLVFVSTLYHRRFHIFTADLSDQKLANVKRLTGEYKSELPRYYYSPSITRSIGLEPRWP